MAHRLTVLVFLVFSFFISKAEAQNRFYHVYIDSDNNTATGCSVNIAEFATTLDGLESRLTITTDSALPPNITSTNWHQCNGASFDAGTAINPAALGLNTGTNGADVFEAEFSQGLLGINTTGNVVFYYHNQSDAASDIVLNNLNGGPIILGFSFPVPALGLLALVILLFLFITIAKKHLSRQITITMVLIMTTTLVWAMNIIIDGQTTDWTGISPVNTDPVGDTSASGSYADFTAVFLTRSSEDIFVRMDVVDVENQAPVADAATDSTLEDNSVTITLTGSDPEGSPITFAIGTAPANGTLGAFNVINNTTSNVQYTPNPDFNGVDNFTVVANDGQVDSAPSAVDVTVTPVNDEPTFTSGGNVSILKTAAPYNQAWASNISAGPADENTQALTFNITSNDNPGLFDVQPSIDTNGILSFTVTPDISGTANLIVNLTDDGGIANGGDDTSVDVAFSINITGVNDEPSFDVGANESVLEDIGAVSVPNWATNILAGPPDEIGQTLTFNITANSNPSLFSVGPAVDSSGTLTYTTAADANGVANISLELMDDGGTADGGDDTSPPQNFSITITAVNDAPSFTAGPDESLLEGAGAQTVNNWATAISPGPADEVGQTVSFNVGNDNNALFSIQPTIDPNGNLTYTPAPAALGSAIVTVSISDNGGVANGGIDTSADQTFNISITAVNDEPSFDVGVDQLLNEDAGAQSVANWATNISAGPPDEAGQILTFNITGNDNPGLFSAGPAVAPNGTLSYTPAANANGVANLSLELMDNGGTANGGDDTSPPQNFIITVNAVNDPPSFTTGADETVLEESGPQTVNGFLTDISPGPIDENGQTVNFGVTNDNNALFSVQPAIDSLGNLTYTPAANTSGTTIVSVEAVDDGGTANGGIDTSATQTFNINVTGINDAPSFTPGPATVSVDEDTGAQSGAWATLISAGPPDEAGQTLTFILNQSSIDPTLTFTTAPTINAAGTLDYEAAANAYGSVTYNVSLMDNGGTANGGVDTSGAFPLTITINPINDPPAAGVLGPYTATTNISVSYAAGSGLLNGITDEATEAADPNGPATPGTNLTIGNGGNPVPTTTVNGGDLFINPTTGAFDYDPPPGFTGLDSFDVVVCDDGIGLPASACSSAITVNITVSGNTVWFIDNTAAPAGDGRLSSPFQSILEFNSSADPGINDYVFFYTGVGSYDGGINLANGQAVLGQGATGTTFNSYTGLSPVAGSAATPVLNGIRPELNGTMGNAVNLATNNALRGFNVVGSTDTHISAAGAAGNLSISQMSLTGIGRAMHLPLGATLNVVLDDLTTSGGTNGINMVNVGGMFSVINNTTFTNTTGDSIYLSNVVAGATFNFNNTTIDNGAFNGVQINPADLSASFTFNQLNITNPGNFGYFQFGGQLNVSSGAINAQFGTAIDLESVIANVNLTSTSSINTNGAGIQLDNVSGTINLGTGSLSNNNSGILFDVGSAVNASGGDATIVYDGSILSSGAATNSVVIEELSGGSIVLNGSINDTGQGIRILGLDNGNSPTVTFNGAIVANTITNNAIVSNSNNDGTINFLGNMDIDTTSGAGFTTINGGIINATGTNNTVDSTTGLAVNIIDTLLGNLGVTFTSVSKNGTSPGIVIANAGTIGFFNVSGNGINNASGGTIQNNTQNGILVQNTDNITLSFMNLTNSADDGGGGCTPSSFATCTASVEFDTVNNITINNMIMNGSDEHGLFAQDISNIDINNSTFSNLGNPTFPEHAIFIRNLSGTTGTTNDSVFNNISITNSGDTGILVDNITATGQLTVQGASLFSSLGEQGILLETNGITANLTTTIGNASAVGIGDTVTFSGMGAAAVNLNANTGNITAIVQNSLFNAGGTDLPNAIQGGSQGILANSDLNVMITGNDITIPDGIGTGRGGISFNSDDAIGVGQADGLINSNTINSPEVTVHGIYISNNGSTSEAQNSWDITNNIISMTAVGPGATTDGITAESHNDFDNPGISSTITGNTVTVMGGSGFTGGVELWAGLSGAPGTNLSTVCSTTSGNNVNAPNADLGGFTTPGQADIVPASFGSGTVLRVAGMPVGNQTDVTIDAFLTGSNTADVTVFPNGTPGTYVGIASCP